MNLYRVEQDSSTVVPFASISFSVISIAGGQLWTENIKRKIPAIKVHEFPITFTIVLVSHFLVTSHAPNWCITHDQGYPCMHRNSTVSVWSVAIFLGAHWGTWTAVCLGSGIIPDLPCNNTQCHFPVLNFDRQYIPRSPENLCSFILVIFFF